MKSVIIAGVALAALLAGASAVFRQDARLLLGGQPGELHPGDQHDRNQLRRGAAGL